MAFLEQRGDWFRIVFTFGGKRYSHSVHSADRRVADAIRGSIDRTILQIQQRLLVVPDGADPKEFLLTGGKSSTPPLVNDLQPAEEMPSDPAALTFRLLKEKYLAALGVGAVEENSLDTIKMHLRHFEKTLGTDWLIADLTLDKLQDHVSIRASAKGIRKRLLSPTTIRKEVASLRAAWNWAAQAKLLAGPFPNKGLKFPNTAEKPPFQTWQEIERQIARDHLGEAEQHDLWDCLFLGPQEIEDLLACVKETAIQAWVYPMFCFAAHTGARRSELLRARLVDLDLDAGSVRIQEKKRYRMQMQVQSLAGTRQLLAMWHVCHVPLGGVLFALAFVHIGAALYYATLLK